MPKLDQRLEMVARQIRSKTHADIGSDHGYLLKSLLVAGRIERGIAIEKKLQPYANSKATLQGCAAEVRLGDGLEPLAAGEADSLSICGMGGRLIHRILTEYPARVPSFLAVQPNRNVDLLRTWGLENGFGLKDEFIVDQRGHEVLVFTRLSDSVDPAYDGLDRQAALLFGPWHIRRRGDAFERRLRTEYAHLSGHEMLTTASQLRLDAIDRLLNPS